MTLAALVAVVAAGYFYGNAALERAGSLALDRLGISPHRFEVVAIHAGRLVLRDVRLGGEGGPSASAVEIGWTLDSVRRLRLDRIVIDDARIGLAVGEEGPRISGLPAGSGDGGPPVVPVDRVMLRDATVTIATPDGTAITSLDAAVGQTGAGSFAGQASMNGRWLDARGAPIPFTADVPLWRATVEAGAMRFDFARATLTAPDQAIALESAHAAATLVDDAASLSLSGVLADRSDAPKWPPLAIKMQGRWDADALVFDGSARTDGGVISLTFEGRHASDGGTGKLRLAPVVLVPDGRQPEDLLPMLGGIVRQVGGTVAASSTVAWTAKGEPSATLTLDLTDVAFEADLVRVSDLDGRLTLASVMPLRTEGTQEVTAMLHASPLPPSPLVARFAIPDEDRLVVERATLSVAGGTLSLSDVAIARGQPLDLALDIDGLDLATVLQLVDVEGLAGRGTISGRIPVHLASDGVRIDGGSLAAAGSGVVRYTGDALPSGLAGASDGGSVDLLRQAIADFHYDSLKLTLDRAADGEGALLLNLSGANPAVLDGYPFVLNIRLETNFDRLAGLLFEGYAAADQLLRQGMTTR